MKMLSEVDEQIHPGNFRPLEQHIQSFALPPFWECYNHLLARWR
jgi:hypothetical protein